MQTDRAPLPSVVRWSIFAAGVALLVVCVVLNPIFAKGGSPGVMPVFVGAATVSALATAGYLLGLRTFLRRYETADVRFAFGPTVLSSIIAVASVGLVLALAGFGFL